MGESRYSCRPPARSVALQPRQFRISNVCRRRTVYDALDTIDGEITQSFSRQRIKREVAGLTFHGTFTCAQSPFVPVPEMLQTKTECAAQQRVYKEFFNVWRGHSQSVCAAHSGSFGTAAVSCNFGVPRAHRPNSARVSSAFLTSQTALLTCTRPTEMVFEELIPGARQLSSNPPQVWTGDSSGWLGRNIVAASTSPPMTSADLSMVSANPSTVEGCSYRSASMGMLKYSTRLQPRHFRPSTVRWTSKALHMQVNKLFQEVLQSDAVEIIKGQLDSILQSFRNSEDLIWKEHRAIVGLEERHKRQSYVRCQPLLFKKEYGPKIRSLEEKCKGNHKALNHFEKGLFLYCKINDPLLLSVSDLHERSKEASKEVVEYANMFYDYCCRFDIETSWIRQMAKRAEGNHELLSVAASLVRDLENEVLELIDKLDDLFVYVKESPNDFEMQIDALRTLILISESTTMYSKVCSSVDEDVTCMPCACKNVRTLLFQKTRYAARFILTENQMAQEIPKMERLVDKLQREIDITRIFYNEKMSRLKGMQGPDTKNYIYKKVEGDTGFSMRDRKWGGRNVCPAIRTQGRGKCLYVASVSCTESRYKRAYADDITVGRQKYHQEEFIVKLSPDHLEDMVTQFYANNTHRSPSEKLDVALERMQRQGVASEEAYNGANFDFQDYHKYHIKGFEKISTERTDLAFAKLKDGKALIGNFKITTDYYRLGGNDIYEIPEDAVFETNLAGQAVSHCVVIVGFGETAEGLAYYIFQNSYGPAWGSDGYGRIACSCLKRLYSPDV